MLVLLIAFNSSSISADERRRQHATMFAFGLPVRRVVIMALIESTVIGIMGTIVGVVFGYAVVQWIVHTMLPDTTAKLRMRYRPRRRTFVAITARAPHRCRSRSGG